MSTCFDASALVKLIVAEDASNVVQRLWRRRRERVRVARSATPSSGVRSRGRCDGAHAGGPGAGRQVPGRGRVAAHRRGRRRPRRCPTGGSTGGATRLGALDAIHLASALSIATPEDRPTFVTFDRRLGEAALAEGLTVLPEVV